MNSKTVIRWLKSNALLIATFAGVVLGIIIGFAVRGRDTYDEDGKRISSVSPTAAFIVSYPGEIFVRLLQLIILPLVITSLISGAASLNAKMSGKIATITIGYFLITSLLSSLLGLIMVVSIKPGNPEQELTDSGKNQTSTVLDDFLDLGRMIIPDNLFKATLNSPKTLVEQLEDGTYNRKVIDRDGTNTLGIIFFCILFGTILGTLGDQAKPVINFFCVIDTVILVMVTGIMWVTPIGVMSIICGQILRQADPVNTFIQLGKFVATVVSGVFIDQWIILQLIYFVIVRKNPLRYYINLFQAWMTAFATASTAATLPISMRCLEEKNKMDRRVVRFVMPIGATVNMNGTALFVTISTVFIAQRAGFVLSVGHYFTIVLTATAASIAAASVPSAALVLIVIVLSAVGLPVSDIAVLYTVDWLNDRFRTTNNMLGDCYTVAVVQKLCAKELKHLDELAAQTGNGEVNQTFHDEDVELTNNVNISKSTDL